MKTISEAITKSPNSNDKIFISISHQGFIERTPLTRIRSLIHGGVGIKAFYTRENDFVEYISLATIQSTILFFTSFGRCYWLKACDIPGNACNPNKHTVQDLLKIAVGDYIRVFLVVEDYSSVDFLDSHYIVFCTKNGIAKRTCMMDFFRQRIGGIRPCINGIKAINIREGDALVNVVVTNGQNDLMLASREGRAIRFNESQLWMMLRGCTGVCGMRLPDGKDDEIVGIIRINDVKTETIMFVCDNGYGIRTNLEDFRITNRANLGVKAMSVTNESGKVVDIGIVTDNTDLIIFNKSGVINRIKVKNIPVKKRATRCVKLIDMLPENDQIICVLKVDDFDKPEDELFDTLK